jgi:hypothetical protein
MLTVLIVLSQNKVWNIVLNHLAKEKEAAVTLLQAGMLKHIRCGSLDDWPAAHPEEGFVALFTFWNM